MAPRPAGPARTRTDYGSALGGYSDLVIERVLCPLARRWAWVETALRVQKRFEEVHGNYLSLIHI